MDVAIDAGADDVVTDPENGIEVTCAPGHFAIVKERLEKAGLKAEFAEIVMKALTEIELSGEDAARMQKLLDAFENLDDVQEIYTSAVLL